MASWSALLQRRLLLGAGVPDPQAVAPAAARAGLRPSLLIKLSFDNSTGAGPMTGLFGMQGIRRPLSDSTAGSLLGMAGDTSFGFAIRPEPGAAEVMDWSVVEAAFDGGADGAARPLRRLASEGGLRFSVAPGETAEYLVALGVFRGGIVTSGLAAHAYHSCLFRDLEDVLESALDDAAESLARAEAVDALLDSAGLCEDRQFLIAHAAHSYSASTELLLSESGEHAFVVNEGEYQMMNTLDLTVDQAFWESRFSPWTLRNELESFADRSSYSDAFGIAFAHDQGVGDCFSPKGRSAYEMPGLSDCFSFMSYEETLNWLLSACLYTSLAGDLTWAKGREPTLAACLASLVARDANGEAGRQSRLPALGPGEVAGERRVEASREQPIEGLFVAHEAEGVGDPGISLANLPLGEKQSPTPWSWAKAMPKASEYDDRSAKDSSSLRSVQGENRDSQKAWSTVRSRVFIIWYSPSLTTKACSPDSESRSSCSPNSCALHGR